jgi:hypothetical protein
MITSTFQQIIDSIEELSVEDQDYLFNLIQKRRIEQRRLEIAKNGEETLQALQEGKAKKGTAKDIKAYLLAEDDE